MKAIRRLTAKDEKSLSWFVSPDKAHDLLLASPSLVNIYGFFDDELLLGIVITMVGAATPCFYITEYYVRSGMTESNWITLLRAVVMEYKALGYYRFYIMYTESDKDDAMEDFNWLCTAHNLVSRCEDGCKPNEASRFTEIWEYLYGRKLFTEHTYVRSFALPPGCSLEE